jgi:hypothetical protein
MILLESLGDDYLTFPEFVTQLRALERATPARPKVNPTWTTSSAIYRQATGAPDWTVEAYRDAHADERRRRGLRVPF